MPISPYSQVVKIKAALIDVFTTNQGPSGMLSTVKSIGGTSYCETGVFPYIGVDIIQTKPEFVSIHKLRTSVEFGISISVRSTTLLIDAYNARDIIIDDGNGNGVMQVLREQYSQLLSSTNGGIPLIEKCDIGQTIFLSNVSENKSSPMTEFFADAVIVFTVYSTVNI